MQWGFETVPTRKGYKSRARHADKHYRLRFINFWKALALLPGHPTSDLTMQMRLVSIVVIGIEVRLVAQQTVDERFTDEAAKQSLTGAWPVSANALVAYEFRTISNPGLESF